MGQRRCAPPWPLYTVGLEALPGLLADAGLPLYGTALRHDTVDVRQRDLRRCALVIGSEGRGVSAEVLALCRETLRIPMSPHCESLNAAAAVLLWEAYRTEEGN
jgi:TrmH family RNA methyltransferase